MCRYSSYNKCHCQQCGRKDETEKHTSCRKATCSKGKTYDHYYDQEVTCKPSNPWLQKQYYDDKAIYHKKKTGKRNKCSCNYCKKHQKRKQFVCQCYEK